jgi:hypothetical protein
MAMITTGGTTDGCASIARKDAYVLIVSVVMKALHLAQPAAKPTAPSHTAPNAKSRTARSVLRAPFVTRSVLSVRLAAPNLKMTIFVQSALASRRSQSKRRRRSQSKRRSQRRSQRRTRRPRRQSGTMRPRQQIDKKIHMH